MYDNRNPNPELLYLVTTFAVEPAHETIELRASLGQLAPDGELNWHVEVIQARRHPVQYSSGAALAIVYQRIDENPSPNVPAQSDIDESFTLLESLIAPKEWSSQQPLTLKLLQATTYRGTGKGLGGSVFGNIITNAAGGPVLGRDGLSPTLFAKHPELRLAIRFYTRGIAAAEQRFLPDACINYARTLECLVGSARDPQYLRRACKRIGLDGDKVLDFLEKTRNQYAIAHVRDRDAGGRPKLKSMPTHKVELNARLLGKQAIERYIRGAIDDRDWAQPWPTVSYFGSPPVASNLPLPKEVLWENAGPFEHEAPGLLPNLVSLRRASEMFGLSVSQIRRLAKRHLIKDVMRAKRVHVPAINLEFLIDLATESASSHGGGVLAELRDAAAALGESVERVRELVRSKRIKGGRIRGIDSHTEGVDVESARYYMWRRNRSVALKSLGQLDPTQLRLLIQSWHQSRRPSSKLT